MNKIEDFQKRAERNKEEITVKLTRLQWYDVMEGLKKSIFEKAGHGNFDEARRDLIAFDAIEQAIQGHNEANT
jgi:hypothetical protein